MIKFQNCFYLVDSTIVNSTTTMQLSLPESHTNRSPRCYKLSQNTVHRHKLRQWNVLTELLFCFRNCVATVNLGCELNLQNINFRTRNSEYSPSRFHGVVMRIREPRCTALIFKSGKLVCTGARNEECANLGTRKFARIIQKLGYSVSKDFFVLFW